MSAASILDALDPERYIPVPIGITKDGKWVAGGDPLTALKELAARPLPPDTQPAGFLVDPTEPGLIPVDQRGSALTEGFQFDVVFPVLHGPYGEDGTVQGLLELANVPYVGSGVAASAAAMDKAIMKELFRSAGLPIVDHIVVMRTDWRRDPEGVERRVAEEIGFPCFVKPANLGSSVGISKVKEPGDLPAALHLAARYDRKLIVEKSAEGYAEIECSVLGNDDPAASIPGEIVPGAEFYDYQAKYFDDTSQLIIPARLSEEATKRVQAMSIAAFKAIDCAGLARVDFFVHPESETILVNEINTMPGFTRISMYPKLWAASGLDYRSLVNRLIELAFERHQDKNSHAFHAG